MQLKIEHNRIRIAHLITNFVVGGAQDYLIMLVKNLDKTKFEPIIMGKMEGEWVQTVQSIPNVTCIDIPSLRRNISIFNDICATFQIWKTCRKLKIDIVHTHSSKPGIIGRLGAHFAGVKGIVHTIHGFSFNEFMPLYRKKFFITLERLMSKFTSVLILYSKENYKTAKELHIGATHSIEMFYYGIDNVPFEEEVNVAGLRDQFGYSADHFVIGFTGRFMEQKGLHILVEAFQSVYKKHPKARLLLVGDGALRPLIEQQINSLGLQNVITITGFRSDIAKILKIMDLFVMTSLWEGLSRSLAEAMFAKLPIVATNVGGTADAIRNNDTGWLISANDVQAVVDALLDAIDNPQKRKDFALHAHLWARNEFDLKSVNDKMESLYMRIISDKNRSLTIA